MLHGPHGPTLGLNMFIIWTLDARASTQRALTQRSHALIQVFFCRTWQLRFERNKAQQMDRRQTNVIFLTFESEKRASCSSLRYPKAGERAGKRMRVDLTRQRLQSTLEMKFTTSLDYGAMEKRARLLLSLFFVMSKLCLSEHQVLRIGMFHDSLCFCLQTLAGVLCSVVVF